MQLIMRSEFDNMRLNDDYEYESDRCGNKQVVKIYSDNKLIAKKIVQKKSTRYFGVKDYKKYLSKID